MNSAVTCAKMGLYLTASMELQVRESNLRPLSLKDIRRRAKLIVKHIEDWKAAREKRALAADVDTMNTWAEAGRGGEVTWRHSWGESGWQYGA